MLRFSGIRFYIDEVQLHVLDDSILSAGAVEGNRYDVVFIDYGDRATLHQTQLRYLNKALIDFPLTAMRGSFNDLRFTTDENRRRYFEIMADFVNRYDKGTKWLILRWRRRFNEAIKFQDVDVYTEPHVASPTLRDVLLFEGVVEVDDAPRLVERFCNRADCRENYRELEGLRLRVDLNRPNALEDNNRGAVDEIMDNEEDPLVEEKPSVFDCFQTCVIL